MDLLPVILIVVVVIAGVIWWCRRPVADKDSATDRRTRTAELPLKLPPAQQRRESMPKVEVAAPGGAGQAGQGSGQQARGQPATLKPKFAPTTAAAETSIPGTARVSEDYCAELQRRREDLENEIAAKEAQVADSGEFLKIWAIWDELLSLLREALDAIHQECGAVGEPSSQCVLARCRVVSLKTALEEISTLATSLSAGPDDPAARRAAVAQAETIGRGMISQALSIGRQPKSKPGYQL